MSNARGDGAVGVQSVDRAVSVLEILAQRGEAGVSEVAADIGVHKSTAFRLLAALEERELVEQTQDRGKYRLGFGILRLASAVPVQAANSSPRSSAKPSTSPCGGRISSSTSTRRAGRVRSPRTTGSVS
jgi:hypothetical protein